MSNVQVKFDNENNPTCLTFTPKQLPINQSPNAQKITWNLAGKLNSGGKFVANSLVFKDGRPSCMTAPVYSTDGKQVSLDDTDNNASGEWDYSLTVLWNGKTYSPSADDNPENGTGSPSIRNK
jgi:hypothetical protein